MNGALENLGPESKGAGALRGPAIQLNNILAPVDFSSASRRGLIFAASVASRFHSKLHLLYVLEPPSLPEWGDAHLAFKEAKLQRAAKKWLQKLPLECGIDLGLIGSATVRSGDAKFEICQTAAEDDIDLITIGLGGLKDVFIGSTTEGLVRRAPCPVLTVRDRVVATEDTQKPSFGLRRILVTTDFSEASKKAFPYAVSLARRFEASLLLVCVVPSHLPSQLSQIGILLDEAKMVSKAREQLPRFRQAELDPYIHVDTLVLHGGPANEICATAETQKADLIVISTRGHTGIRRLPLGSLTEDVVRHASCSVLVIREREDDFIKI